MSTSHWGVFVPEGPAAESSSSGLGRPGCKALSRADGRVHSHQKSVIPGINKPVNLFGIYNNEKIN